MGSFSGDETPGGQVTPAAGLSDADRALLLAIAAWRVRHPLHEDNGGPNEPAPDLLAGLLERLAPAWARTLLAASDRDLSWAGSNDRSTALDELRVMHRATARVDLARVHPTWLVRALREESPAVQRLVAAALTSCLRDHVQAGLLLDSEDLLSERAAAPQVASWVMALWTERLVGGESERADDPPALIVLSRLSLRAGYRICRLAGLCKLILAGEPLRGDPATSERSRHDWLARRLESVSAGPRTLAARDIEGSRSSRLPSRHRAARIGLATMARLLAQCEPFRLRWALQHWPYPVAKLIRSLMPAATNRPFDLVESETLILKTVWERLNLEGRLARAWPLP